MQDVAPKLYLAMPDAEAYTGMTSENLRSASHLFFAHIRIELERREAMAYVNGDPVYDALVQAQKTFNDAMDRLKEKEG